MGTWLLTLIGLASGCSVVYSILISLYIVGGGPPSGSSDNGMCALAVVSGSLSANIVGINVVDVLSTGACASCIGSGCRDGTTTLFVGSLYAVQLAGLSGVAVTGHTIEVPCRATGASAIRCWDQCMSRHFDLLVTQTSIELSTLLVACELHWG